MTISKEFIKLLEESVLAAPMYYAPSKPRDNMTYPVEYKDKKANDTQHGGTHYKQFKGCEPWDVITNWKLGYLDGTALKYIARWRDKGGVEDLKKAIHFLQKTIEVESEKTLHEPSGRQVEEEKQHGVSGPA